ncbi:MAG: Uncharacterised protein [Hyphomonas sp. TMED17]|nr:MAG: Uncharacterised protein [Hyphomonas sp. TMED17]
MFAGIPDPGTGGIAGHNRATGVERDHAIGHAFQNALIVILHALNIVEQLGVFEGDRNLRRKGFQSLLVLFIKGHAFFVQNLRHADNFAVLVYDRNA